MQVHYKKFDNLECMKKLIVLVTLVSALVCGCNVQKQNTSTQPRKVAVQLYSLNRFTLEEAIEKVKHLKLDGVECYPGQRLSAKYPKVKVNYTMNAEQRAFMKKLLKDANLKMVSFGVISPEKEDEIEKICQFVKEMGGEKIMTESSVYAFRFWDKIAKKYGLTVCVHHHATNSGRQYWDTCLVKKCIKDYSNIRVCPDPGHWSRSGIDPVKSLKELDGKIASIHFKDQREFNNIKNQPAPFGEGVLDVKGMLAELDRQGYNGYFVIEYEDNWLNNIPEIEKCVKYLRNN